MIKVSVVVPVYNVEKYLERCLLSLTNQTLKEIEIICIDDGSSDGSGAILDSFAARDSRVKAIHKANAGVSCARNDAIAIAQGEYIAFVDSDDYVDERAYENAYTVAKRGNADIVVFGGEVYCETPNNNEYLQNAFNFFRENLNVKNAVYVDNSVFALTHQKGSWPLIWNKIYKRQLVLDSKGFDTTLALGEDEAFLFSIFPLAKKVVYIEGKYYHYLRNRPDSATDRLVMDFEGKAFSNLHMAKVVKENWKNLGILEAHSQEYLDRYTDLLFDNEKSIEFSPDAQYTFAQQVFELFNEFPAFSKQMIDHWYEMLWLRSERERLLKEVEQKQNEIWGLINSKNISDGQIQVLKEVAVARESTEKKEKKPGKVKQFFKDLRSLFKGGTLKDINNISYKLLESGYKTYKNLKVTYGKDCVFFTCAVAGIGDAYLTSCYASEWLKQKKVKNFRFLLCGKAEKNMVEALFPYLKDKCVLITPDQHEWLRNFTRLCDFKPDFYFFHHYDYMQPHLQISEKLQGYKGLSMTDLYLWQMGLPANAKCSQPKAPEGQTKEIDAIFTEHNLKKGKTVVIAPYSTCLGSLGQAFWAPIITALTNQGYTVCTNCGKSQSPLPGTVGVFIEFKYVLNFMNAAGYFIGIRSGLCDVISNCTCKKIVIHPYESTQWGNGNAIKYVGLVNMGFSDGSNLTELEIQENEDDKLRIQSEILKEFSVDEKKK
ncbi:MAG: glycosyltransferase [Clostridia bacterium]|nr:glycosyltransferase [Clostridia bacterium]